VPIDRQRLQQLACSSRRLGYLAERLSEVSVGSYAILAGLTTGSPPGHLAQAINDIVAAFPYRYYLDTDIQGGDPLPVSLICSPTYTAHEMPDLLLAVLVLGDLPAGEVAERGWALAAAAAAVTKELGGANPWTPG
jgi:hypothetical protein